LLKGGNAADVSGSVGWIILSHLELGASLQYERWNFPELNPGPRNNISTAFEIRLWPKMHAGSVSSAASSSAN
jgi:hypothetical protein